MSLKVGGIVLCGGRGKRMGASKATLPFGQELMLPRVVRILSEVVEPIVVVAGSGQQLPQLPPNTIVARDEREGNGPLEGLRVGLRSIAPHAESAYVTSCDAPLLTGKFISRMIAELGQYDAAVPIENDFHHPLAAVYRTKAVEKIEQQLARDRRKMSEFLGKLETNFVSVERLRACDRDLWSLHNVNCPADYLRALESAGFQIDSNVRERLGL